MVRPRVASERIPQTPKQAREAAEGDPATTSYRQRAHRVPTFRRWCPCFDTRPEPVPKERSGAVAAFLKGVAKRARGPRPALMASAWAEYQEPTEKSRIRPSCDGAAGCVASAAEESRTCFRPVDRCLTGAAANPGALGWSCLVVARTPLEACIAQLPASRASRGWVRLGPVEVPSTRRYRARLRDHRSARGRTPRAHSAVTTEYRCRRRALECEAEAESLALQNSAIRGDFVRM